MAQKEHQSTPAIIGGILYTDDEYTGLHIGSPAWFDWLRFGRTFYVSETGSTMRCELRRNSRFWYTYKRVNGKLCKRYAGRSERLTVNGLADVTRHW